MHSDGNFSQLKQQQFGKVLSVYFSKCMGAKIHIDGKAPK